MPDQQTLNSEFADTIWEECAKRQLKWDRRFMQIAYLTASWSKDPNTKVGCVVIDSDFNQLSGGFNGLPRGIADSPDRLANRDIKLLYIVHAEANAVAAAARNGHSLKGATCYVTRRPCCQCASLLIQAGVAVVVVPNRTDEKRWLENVEAAERVLVEAGVTYRRVPE